MTDQSSYPPPPPPPSEGSSTPPPPPAPAPEYSSAAPAPAYGSAAPAYAAAPPATGGAPAGPIGEVRSTGVAFLLFVVTFGIYGWYYWYKTHEEMKRHTGDGIGGAVALILAIFVGIVMPYLTSAEVGAMREKRGQEKRVSGATGLWYFPGIFILVGPIVWFVKTNGALNDYWRSQGAQG